MAKDPRKMTPMERRDKLIKDRADRIAKMAAKKDMTPEQFKKQMGDTFANVLGGAATLLPIGRVMQLANVAYKGYKGAGAATKVAGAAKAATKSKAATKTTTTAAKAKPKPKASAKKKTTSTKTTTATKPKTNAKPKTAAKKRPAAKKGTTAATTSRMTSDRAKRAILGGAVTSATLATIDDIRKSGKGKAKAAAAMPTGPKPRPKRRTGMSEGNTVAGSSGRRGSDPRKDFASKATPGAKKAAPKKVPTTKSRDKDGQGTGKIGLPAGAKRKFSGGYNSKTEKLRNIGGKT